MATTWWSVFSSVFVPGNNNKFGFRNENVAKCDSAMQTPGKLKSSLITPLIYLTLFYPHFICTQELTDEVNKASSTFTSSGISLLRAKAHQSWLGGIKIIIIWITTHAKVIFAYRIFWLHRRWFPRSPRVDTVYLSLIQQIGSILPCSFLSAWGVNTPICVNYHCNLCQMENPRLPQDCILSPPMYAVSSLLCNERVSYSWRINEYQISSTSYSTSACSCL